MASQDKLKLILASGSPRRRQLLESLGLEFSIITTDIDESQHRNELPQDYVSRLAREKAAAAQLMAESQSCAILAADTIVCQGKEVFGKPVDKNDALRIWNRLSGKKHQVITAVCLKVNHQSYSEMCITEVSFDFISVAQMASYWQTGEPQDKAGGYAIQGFASAWVQQINGSYSNVVGLPLFEVNKMLANVGLNWL